MPCVSNQRCQSLGFRLGVTRVLMAHGYLLTPAKDLVGLLLLVQSRVVLQGISLSQAIAKADGM